MRSFLKVIIFFLLGFACIGYGAISKPAIAKKSGASFTKLHALQCKKSAYQLSQYENQLIILDAGHGGTDEGTKASTVFEKKITLITALLAKQYLEELGYKVKMTRTSDVFLALPKRVALANQAGAALFVSIHYNHSKNDLAKGIEVFYPDAKQLWRAHASKRLARCVLSQLLQETDAPSRGVKEGNFHVIRETEMPAVLIEGGFVSNLEERELLKSKEYLGKVAKGVAQGIHRYLRS